MKYLSNILLPTLLGAWLLVGVACVEQNEWSEGYDIPWPQVTIADLPATAPIEAEVEIKGTNLQKVNTITVGDTRCAIVEGSASANSIRFKLPRRVASGFVTVKNDYRRSAVSTTSLTVTYPTVRVLDIDPEIALGKAFKIYGTDVDLIRRVSLNQTVIEISGSDKQNELSIPTADAGLKAGEPITLKFEAFGQIEVLEDLASKTKVIVPADTYEPVLSMMVMNFEKAGSFWENAADVVPDNKGLNLSGLVAPEGANYYSCIKDQTAGWKNFAYVGSNNAGAQFDLAAFTEPHITMLVNTNGKAGYPNPFFTQGGSTKDNHLTDGNADPNHKYGDNYMVGATNGWEWRSYPVAKLFGDFKATGIFEQVQMRFTSGNVGNGDTPADYETHIDNIMITDGWFGAVKLFDFEDGYESFWKAGTDATVGLNKQTAAATGYQGNNYFSIVSATSVEWNSAYGNLTTTVPAAPFENLYINFQIKTDGNGGYFQLELVQGNDKWGMHFKGNKLYPDDYQFPKTNGWEWRSYKLTNKTMDDWGGTGNWIDFSKEFTARIEFKGGNVKGAYEINLDNVHISSAPMDYSNK